MDVNETMESEIQIIALKYDKSAWCKTLFGDSPLAKSAAKDLNDKLIVALTEMYEIALREAAEIIMASLPDDSRSAQSQAEHHAAAILGRIKK